ncbi:hypothetical protein V5R04_00550 [Jonesiaceae bacterium BS-20]|uniref:LPXTG cell wall anchor domain-containing protein n=1 Tax=Jonesiaceae bacterium BS-20 TaxID=3120821 RepID=A0AAU7DYD9_9MICO
MLANTACVQADAPVHPTPAPTVGEITGGLTGEIDPDSEPEISAEAECYSVIIMADEPEPTPTPTPTPTAPPEPGPEELPKTRIAGGIGILLGVGGMLAAGYGAFLFNRKRQPNNR